ncbi:MAG: MarR family transcriptional regulator [Clostridia bacterium]|nr:MarR family transcriptional regulator [Clostridia bacterium]
MEATAVSQDLLLENQLCFPLYACAKEVVRRYREPLEPLGLTYTQYLVMMTLWEYGGMTEGDLGKILHLESGTLTPLLKRLEKQELLTRVRLESNERKLFLDLTEKGRAMRQQATSVPCAIREQIPLETEEIVMLKNLLCKAMKRMHSETDA